MSARELSDLIARAAPSLTELRHDLHAHPEVGFAEHRTTEVIRERLSTLGLVVAPTTTATGAVTTLTGTRPGRRVLLRADIDALPVAEARDLPFRSTQPGVMHACGHDVHTAALLGAAEVLSHLEDRPGTFTFVFQPAEEALGGARTLIEDGLLERHPCDAVLGAHVTSLVPVGVVAVRPGIAMSRADAFRIVLEGQGGHGALAGDEGNVLIAAGSVLTRLREVVADLSYETTPLACSAGIVRAGTANNVVPRRAEVAGTLRTFTAEQTAQARARLDVLLAEIAATTGVRAHLEITGSSPAVVNDPALTALATAATRSVVGDSHVVEMAPTSASDDISEFLECVPGCYLFVGGALADGTSGPHHSGDFAVEDAAVAIQAHVLAAAALALAEPPA
ncbi:MAG: M20 metallopeptidase family protein [Acidimicrobiales bacterium]